MGNLNLKLFSAKYMFLLFGLLAMALFSGVSLYWIAFWFLLLWLTGSALWLFWTARNLEMELQVQTVITERNSSVPLHVSLLNRTFLPLPLSELYFTENREGSFPRHYHIYYRNYRIEEKMEIQHSAPYMKWQKRFQVECFSRGHHFIGPLMVRLYSPFGNMVIEKRFFQLQEIVVRPRLLNFTGTFSPYHKELREKRINNSYTPLDSRESYDLRPFAHGDSPKLINWKVSARQGDLYARRFENTGENRLLLCVELSPSLYKSSLEQDLVLEKALSLMGYLLAEGFQVGALTSDGKIRYLPSGPGKKQLFLARKMFTKMSPAPRGNLLEHVLNDSRKFKETSLFWVVPNLSASYLLDLAKLKKRGIKLTHFVTSDELEMETPNPLLPRVPLQLGFRNNSVELGEVKIS